MFRLDKACFLLDLRTGSEYIGWVGAVVTVLNMLIDIYHFTNPDLIGSFIMFDIIISLIHYLISVCLIKAAKNNNHKLLVPWLIGTILNLFIMNLFNLVMAITIPVRAAYYLLALLLMDTVAVYLWLCVYSFYHTLVKTPITVPENIVIEDAGTTRI